MEHPPRQRGVHGGTGADLLNLAFGGEPSGPGNADGQGFGADRAWLYVTLLTVGYLISRGIAKAGSYEHDNDPRS